MPIEKDKDPTIIVEDTPDQEKYEILKEKLRYKQALRENSKKIDHKQVRLNIQANALPSKTFFIMNALAAIIAGYGLLTNSSAVVIGAMLVAMMLGPISGIALSLIDNRWILFRTALTTLSLGILMIYAIGIILGLMNIDIPITHEILSRTQPTIMDLMIALAGGAAGAFASVSPRLSVAVVGVAVATALVPPLVASGILFAHMEWRNAANAFILAATNIIAIQVSSSLVLWVAGFRRGSDIEVKSNVIEFIKRNAISLIFLLILTIYLSLNFMHMLRQQLYETSIKTEVETLLNKNNNIVDTIQFEKHNDFTLIRIVVRGDTPPNAVEVGKLNDSLADDLKGKPSVAQVRFIVTEIIEAPNSPTISIQEREEAGVITTY
ncbi:TIGR00341 family protein [Acinetobacter rongchengensis]|uniref:TIGR00341 family protein n=1 Tax=Acinetobacter rongchengensis TaxID=2419601 RepID=A0A3A8FEZ2_9GAMM|nr:TIGR00341 family protein [Acinetobacter rongchengensis]RKG39303.1 TIGR00341 family protein [Acinetobacter rongchengensis]